MGCARSGESVVHNSDKLLICLGRFGPFAWSTSPFFALLRNSLENLYDLLQKVDMSKQESQLS